VTGRQCHAQIFLVPSEVEGCTMFVRA